MSGSHLPRSTLSFFLIVTASAIFFSLKVRLSGIELLSMRNQHNLKIRVFAVSCAMLWLVVAYVYVLR